MQRTITIYYKLLFSVTLFKDLQMYFRHKIAQHKSIEDRLEAAKGWNSIPYKVLVDKMDNEAARYYAGLPNRNCIILDGIVKFMGTPGPFSDLSNVVDWLTKFKKDQ